MTETSTATVERPRFTRGDHSKTNPEVKRSNQHGGRRLPGPYSRWLTGGGKYNGSSREGRFLNACRKELEDHLGGIKNITVGQRILIERICFLRLRAALFDEQFLDKGKPLGELDYRVYLAISNSLVRATRELGLGKHPKGTKPSLDSIIARARAP